MTKILRFITRIWGSKRATPVPSHTANLTETVNQSDLIVEAWEEIAYSDDYDNPQKIFEFSDRLLGFMQRVNKRWFGGQFPRLRPENQKRLVQIRDDLMEIYEMATRRYDELQRDADLQKYLEEMPSPEEDLKAFTRNYDSWQNSPYSLEGEIEDAAELPTPE